MEYLGDIFGRLTPTHRRALGWFLEHAGKTVGWPQPIEFEGKKLDLAVTAMGIYKPAWSVYSLSVWQSMRGAYPDQPPIPKPDGSWVYAYYQQNKDPEKRDQFFTNRGLVKCMVDRVPIGVFRQVKQKPRPLYHVLGLAMINNWDDGLFYLEGFNVDRRARPRGPEAEFDYLQGLLDSRKGEIGELDPSNIQDARKRVLANIIRRQGQQEFRAVLLDAYGNKCAMTQTDAPQALDAAHIVPYQGPRTNDPTNGLLLRGDLHTLFDYGLIAVDTAKMSLLVKDQIRGTTYGALHGSEIVLPKEASLRPSLKLLDHHREWAAHR